MPYELLRDQPRTFLKRLGDFADAAFLLITSEPVPYTQAC
jgi:hypothetical protein